MMSRFHRMNTSEYTYRNFSYVIKLSSLTWSLLPDKVKPGFFSFHLFQASIMWLSAILQQKGRTLPLIHFPRVNVFNGGLRTRFTRLLHWGQDMKVWMRALRCIIGVFKLILVQSIRRGSIIETFIAGEFRSKVKAEFPFPCMNY